jgi:hypothetical protein
MQATRDEIEALFKLQQIDLDSMHAQKTLDELPQREIILTAREKKANLQKKAVQVGTLKRDVLHKIARIEDEDASLAKKEAGVQAAIDAAHGDYRNVEARTKELAGIMRRRETIAGNKTEVEAELDKLVAMETQIREAIENITTHEQQAIASFQKQGGELKTSLAQAEAAREALYAQLSTELAQAYKRAAARSGGVAVAVLDGSKCGACRVSLAEGRLLDLRAQAPLGICPSCKRLLVIA